jgi:ABC-2 type transport system permease protein
LAIPGAPQGGDHARDGRPWHPLFELTLARWRSFYREPSTLFWTFGFPILLSFILGVAFRNPPAQIIDVAIEEGPLASSLRDELASRADIHPRVLSEAAAEQALRTGKIAIFVRQGPPRTYRFDPTRPESRLARLVVDDALQRAEGRRDVAPSSDDAVTEKGSRYIDFLIPGLIGMGLMSSGLWGVGFTLTEMRTRKLIKRLVATPMRKTHFLASFLVLRAGLLVLELPTLVGFGYFAFSVPLRGSLVLLALIATMGAVLFAGMGLLVASRSKNTTVVSGWINVVSFPMLLCSGVFFSTERFPEAIKPWLRMLPLTALNDALRAVMIDGAALPALLVPIACLAVWSVASFAAALTLFHWS